MDIRTITVLGAGTMGHGIAHGAALAGYAFYVSLAGRPLFSAKLLDAEAIH